MRFSWTSLILAPLFAPVIFSATMIVFVRGDTLMTFLTMLVFGCGAGLRALGELGQAPMDRVAARVSRRRAAISNTLDGEADPVGVFVNRLRLVSTALPGHMGSLNDPI
jgi:hypothetical protein